MQEVAISTIVFTPPNGRSCSSKRLAGVLIGPNCPVRIRSDAKWSVPEPELTLLINPAGAIVGYTIGNDMSSRDIEGENPLYLPQAKIYDGSCALGPGILLSSDPLAKSTAIHLDITRAEKLVFHAMLQHSPN